MTLPAKPRSEMSLPQAKREELGMMAWKLDDPDPKVHWEGLSGFARCAYCRVAEALYAKGREDISVEHSRFISHLRNQFKRIIRKTSYNSSASNISYSALGMKLSDFTLPKKTP